MRFYRPSWVEVNLDNLSYNFGLVKKLVKPGTRIMVTVKADAYGHGLIPVAKKLAACGVDYFGVASIDEGVALRQAGIKQPVLILGVVLKSDIQPIFKYGLIPTVCSLDLAASLNQKARRRQRAIDVHVKVDTGMGRIGVMHQDAEGLVKKLQKLKFIHIAGIFTHFAFADIDQQFTEHQLGLFERLLEKLSREHIDIPLVHSANSMGTISFKKAHFNLVRPGLVIYGLYPKEGLGIKLKPLLSLKTKIVYLKRMPAGSGISYGHTYITRKNTTIVTLPIGYGDGYPRSLSNVGPVLIRGSRFKICGRVCMDQVMVDVGDFPVRLGDEAVLIGRQGKEKITTEELAGLCATIPYEIVCGLGSRLPRVYI